MNMNTSHNNILQWAPPITQSLRGNEFKYKKCEPDASNEEKQKLFAAALDEAMAQMDVKGYSAKYQGSGKAIYQAAFAFLGRGDIEMREKCDAT